MVAFILLAALYKAKGSISEADVSGLASWLATEDKSETAVPTALTLPRHRASDSSTHSTIMLPALPLNVNLYSPPDCTQLLLYDHLPPGETFMPRRVLR